jgi:hypothetical protein
VPQHLKIEAEGNLVGCLSTSNKGGTRYDVRLRVPELGAVFSLADLDTGIQRQPQDDKARAEDFKDDFIHVRRCIAATVAGSDCFLKKLREQGAQAYVDMKPILMHLMTNDFDRGLIQIHPIDNESVNVVVTIGVGSKRVPNSSPKDKYELDYEDVDVSGTSTQTERALKALRSIGPDLLRSLADRPPN